MPACIYIYIQKLKTVDLARPKFRDPKCYGLLMVMLMLGGLARGKTTPETLTKPVDASEIPPSSHLPPLPDLGSQTKCPDQTET